MELEYGLNVAEALRNQRLHGIWPAHSFSSLTEAEVQQVQTCLMDAGQRLDRLHVTTNWWGGAFKNISEKRSSLDHTFMVSVNNVSEQDCLHTLTFNYGPNSGKLTLSQ